jgi:hypothetical protein
MTEEAIRIRLDALNEKRVVLARSLEKLTERFENGYVTKKEYSSLLETLESIRMNLFSELHSLRAEAIEEGLM